MPWQLCAACALDSGRFSKVLSTDTDTAFMNEEFQEYLRYNNIQHVTKDVMADNQLALVDSIFPFPFP